MEIKNDEFEAASETNTSISSVVATSVSGSLNLRTRVVKTVMVGELLGGKYEAQVLPSLIQTCL